MSKRVGIDKVFLGLPGLPLKISLGKSLGAALSSLGKPCPSLLTMCFVGPKCNLYLIKLVKCSAAGCHRSSSSRAEAGRQVAFE